MVKSETVTVLAGFVDPGWTLVYSQDFPPQSEEYTGKCTHEDIAFLVDPMMMVGEDWKKWAKYDLSAQIIEDWPPSATPLRLRVSVGKRKVLWGVLEWPAVKVESWHHGSPGVLAILVAIIIILGLIAWLWQKAEEVPWVFKAGAGIGLVLLALVMLEDKKK